MTIRSRGTAREKAALNAFVKLVRAAESVSGRVESRFNSLALTVSQFGVLEALLHLGPLYQKDLGRKILKSRGNITFVVNNLEKRGLVKRIRDADDRRHCAVHLTGAGRKLITSLFPGQVSRIMHEMSVLSAAEQRELGRLCKKVGLGGGVDRRAMKGERHVEKDAFHQ